MNDHDGDEHRIMNHMEEQMDTFDDSLETAPTPYLLRSRIARDQSTALVLLVKNLSVLVKDTYAEDDTVALCRELCLTAEFFNKILQGEKFENIPF